MRKTFCLLTILFSGMLTSAGSVNALGATLSLSPSAGTVNVGGNLPVSLTLDTAGQSISSVSAVLSFDPTIFTATVTPGTLLTVTSQSGNGTLTINVPKLLTPFSGSGNLATVNFYALKAGTATVTIALSSGTGGSVVTGSNGITNILDLVNNGSYTVSPAGTVVSTASAASQTPVTGAGDSVLLVLASAALTGTGVFLYKRRYAFNERG